MNAASSGDLQGVNHRIANRAEAMNRQRLPEKAQASQRSGAAGRSGQGHLLPKQVVQAAREQNMYRAPAGSAMNERGSQHIKEDQVNLEFHDEQAKKGNDQIVA